MHAFVSDTHTALRSKENGSVDSDEPSPSCHSKWNDSLVCTLEPISQTVSFGDSPVDTGTLPGTLNIHIQ